MERVRWRVLWSVGVAVGLLALAAGIVTTPAVASTAPVSQASSLGADVNLGNGTPQVELTDPPSSASNNGSQASQTSTANPSISQLNSLGFMHAGALAEIATAEPTGTSYACAGLVQTGGSLEIGSAGSSCSSTGSGSGGFSFDLSNIPGLGTVLSSVANVEVSFDSVTAFATEGPTGTGSGSASLNGGSVTVTLLGGLLPPVTVPLSVSGAANENLLSDIITALSSNGTLGSVVTVLSDSVAPLINITANYQPTTDSVSGDPFTISALHMALLGTTGATADLAEVTAGPNTAPLASGTLPGAPSGLSATAGNGSATLTWSAPGTSGSSAIVGYDIFEGTSPGQEATTPVNSTPVSSTSYTVTGLTNETTYYFTVAAVNASGQGPASNEVAVKPTSSVPTTSYTAITPTRICDTRTGNPSQLSGADAQCNGKTLAPGASLAVQVGGLAGLPSGATAVVMNVTATDTTAPGYLTVWPDRTTMPTASDLNWTGAGQSVANLATITLPSNGIDQFFNGSQGYTDLIVDIEGYYAPSSAKGAGLYNPLSSPERICDTRQGNPSDLSGEVLSQCEGKAPLPGSSLSVQVAGLGGVPSSGVAAVVLNLTAVQPSATGFLTVYPSGQGLPMASDVNYSPGAIVANRVVVGVGSNGQVRIFSSAGAPNIVVDVSGWYTNGSNPSASGDTFTAASDPVRICDTRPGNPSDLSGAQTQCNGKTLQPSGTLEVQVTGLGGVPSDATAVVANVTITSTTATSYLSLYPSGLSLRPVVSDLNWGPGATRANMAMTTLGSNGAIEAYNAAGTVNVIVDVAGWFS